MSLLFWIIALVLIGVGLYYIFRGALGLGIGLIVLGLLIGILLGGGVVISDDDVDDGRSAATAPGRPFYSRA